MSEFTIHRRASYAAVVGIFVFLILVESSGVHFILRHHSFWAWLCTLSSLSIVAWLVADARAVVARGHMLTDDALMVQRGTRVRASIPYRDILAVETSASPNVPALDATLLRRVDVVVRTRTQQVLLTVDEPSDFTAALARRLSAL